MNFDPVAAIREIEKANLVVSHSSYVSRELNKALDVDNGGGGDVLNLQLKVISCQLMESNYLLRAIISLLAGPRPMPAQLEPNGDLPPDLQGLADLFSDKYEELFGSQPAPEAPVGGPADPVEVG